MYLTLHFYHYSIYPLQRDRVLNSKSFKKKFPQILVAPILRLGQTKRNIYLPKINSEDAWFDWNGKMYTGDYWLNNTEVDIDTIPYFVRKKHNFNSRHQP